VPSSKRTVPTLPATAVRPPRSDKIADLRRRHSPAIQLLFESTIRQFIATPSGCQMSPRRSFDCNRCLCCWEGSLRLAEQVRFRRNGRLLYHGPEGLSNFAGLLFKRRMAPFSRSGASPMNQ
jgi:hypothetical protein